MAPVARASKAQRAYEAIKAGIADGTYGPGVRLVLDQLARDLEVSSVPIREAVRRLEAEGWVVFTHNIGAQVASIDLGQYTDAMETLALLEGCATAAAAPHLDAAGLAEAERINDLMRQSLASFDPLGFTQRNHDFHEVLCAPCPNRHLHALLEKQWQQMNHLRRSTFSLVPGRAQASVEEHVTLLQMIGAGKSATVVERFARQHKMNTLKALAEHG
ncbi:MAG: GntR family transcriptional regulator [Jatrophihabitantaceae bacterium]